MITAPHDSRATIVRGRETEPLPHGRGAFSARVTCVAVCLALLAPPGRAAPDVAPQPLEPPPVGQPPTFTVLGGAVGHGFRVTQTVTPTSVQAEDAVTLTVRISAANAPQPPRRPRLWELKAYQDLESKKHLKMDRPDKKNRDQPDRTPGPLTWEFDYRLRPLNESVTRLPSFTFHYFKPSASAELPGRYESVSASGVPLTVTAKVERPIVSPTPVQVPEALLHLVVGPEVRERRAASIALPSVPVLLMLLLTPPLLALAWYRLWKRWYPDAARLARLRQSRAARHALHALEKLPAEDTDARAHHVAAIAAGYLQHRLGLPTVEPTPAEVTAYLERIGAPAVLAGKTAEFFRACDAARFAPDPARGEDDLGAAARRLILTLESEPWAASQV
jgi:hypothetical protein